MVLNLWQRCQQAVGQSRGFVTTENRGVGRMRSGQVRVVWQPARPWRRESQLPGALGRCDGRLGRIHARHVGFESQFYVGRTAKSFGSHWHELHRDQGQGGLRDQGRVSNRLAHVTQLHLERPADDPARFPQQSRMQVKRPKKKWKIQNLWMLNLTSFHFTGGKPLNVSACKRAVREAWHAKKTRRPKLTFCILVSFRHLKRKKSDFLRSFPRTFFLFKFVRRFRFFPPKLDFEKKSCDKQSARHLKEKNALEGSFLQC